MQYPCGWVSPFGHCRIKACCQLPDTFRRLPRPSSPLTAKASTVCALSLDHITPRRLSGCPYVQRVARGYCMSQATVRLLASTTHLGSFKSQDTCHIPNFQGTPSRLQRQTVSKVCAHLSRVVGLGGLEPPASPLSGVRSNHLSYRPGKSGGADRDRTDDPLLAKQVLSQLSYSPWPRPWSVPCCLTSVA